MSEDKLREQFEAWCSLDEKRRFGDMLWYCWQACAKIKDAEIKELNLEIQKRDKCSFIGAMRDCPTHGESKEIEQLNTYAAMLHDALDYHQEQTRPISKTQEALSATEADVTKWVNGVRSDAVAEYLRQAQATMCTKVVR